MIACLNIPAFSLQVALHGRPDLVGRPAALAPPAGQDDLLGPCTAAAQRAGIRASMRLGEALATCSELALVEDDPAAVEEEWEQMLRRLEEAGFAVEAAVAGCAYFETAGVERLAGGLDAVLRRALEAAGLSWMPRIGAASRRFAALAAASVAPPCRAIVVDDGETALFLEPLPLDVLPLPQDRRKELSELGIRRLGDLASLPGSSVADRLGEEAADAWRQARGEDDASVIPRKQSLAIAETLAFPEAIANALTLELAVVSLLDRLLARPERAGHAPAQIVAAFRLVGGGSWRRVVTLREPTADPSRLRAAVVPKLAELPAPVIELHLEIGVLSKDVGVQQELVRPRGNRLRDRLRIGLRQVRSAAGADAVCSVMEVAPWSRIPEARALLVPRDD